MAALLVALIGLALELGLPHEVPWYLVYVAEGEAAARACFPPAPAAGVMAMVPGG